MDSTQLLKEELRAIDKTIEKKKKAIRLGEALKELKNDPNFKLVILEGYVEAEAKRLFKILTDPSGVSPYSNEEIQLKLAAISHFKSYIGTDDYVGTIEIEAERAPDEIIMEENYRDEVTANAAQTKER
jgi:hypothetical protein